MRTGLCIAIFTLYITLTCGDRSQADCQDNEVFIQCGRCEGTCKSPVVETCDPNCRLPRCECQLSEGFVRTHDGACIKATDCATYVGIEIYGDGNYKMFREPSPTSDLPALAPSTEFENTGAGTSAGAVPGAAPPAYGPESQTEVDNAGNNEYDENTVGGFAEVGADYGGGVHLDDPNGAQGPAYPPAYQRARDEPYLSAYVYGPPQYRRRRVFSSVKAL